VLEEECAWLAANDVFPRALLDRSREVATEAIRDVKPVFIHGDLQVAHVLLDAGRLTGVLDWSEGGQGDPAYDLATLTLGHPEHLAHVLEGYGGDVDPAVIRGWRAMRSLTAIRWLLEHGYDPAAPGCEIDVLKRL
jgi:aminoglycoside phosphotransferase (APT) family kinase protein